jgi:quercetin dioxygenase-like cupin family protein
MPKLVGFSRFAALLEEQISEKISRRILSGDQGIIVWWSIGAGVHVEPHSHPNEQIVWMLKGKMEFRLGSEQGLRPGATWWSFREAMSRRHHGT